LRGRLYLTAFAGCDPDAKPWTDDKGRGPPSFAEWHDLI
jgi:hypothetical protein